MGFFSSVLAPRHNAAFKESFWKEFLFGAGLTSNSGKTISLDTSLQVTTVLACVRVLANGIAQVPLKLRRKIDGGGSEDASDHPLYRVLYRRPNPWQTSFEFRQMLMAHLVLTGNFVAFKNVVRGQVRELIPFEPGEVVIERKPDRSLIYRVTRAGGETQEFPQAAIWHVRGLSLNGYLGLDATKMAREAIGLALVTEEAHSKFHSNGSQTSGVYSVDGTLNDAQYGALSRWVSSHIGGENKFKPLILDRNGKWTATGMSGVDAQHLETRRFQIEELCRAFNVQPVKVHHYDKAATYASRVEAATDHVVDSLSPWYECLEQSLDENLLTDADQKGGIYSKFFPNGLMRGAPKERSEFYYRMWQMGALNANEIRAYEDQNPYDGGDVYRVPVNMASTDAAGDDLDAGSGGQEAEQLAPPRRSPMNAGRVLSSRNERRIRDADSLLNECLSELDKEEDNAETDS